MSALQVFNFQSSPIRTVLANDGEIWFIAKDVALALGYKDTKQAISTHCKHSSQLREISGGNFTTTTTLQPASILIPESDVYRLTMKSTLPTAEPFQDWLADDVIPSIRKTGSYTATQAQNFPLAEQTFKSLKSVAEMFGLTGNQALLSANKGTRAVTGIDFQNLLGIELIAPSKEKYLTPTELGKDLGLSGMKVNQLLASKGFQVKNGKAWLLTELGKPLATLLDTNKKHSDGTPVQQIKWFSGVIETLKGDAA